MIEELRTFIEVVKCRNFTKAAERVSLSQPSVSLHIKRLESYFDTILIQRSNKTKELIITPQGELLYEKALEIVGLIEETKEDLNSLNHRVRGNFKIGASLTIGDYLLPEILADFSNKYPNLEIEVTIANTCVIAEKIKAGELHIGLIEGGIGNYDLKKVDFYRDNFVLVASKKSHLIKETFHISSLKGETWILREEGSGTKEYIMNFLKRYNITPKNILVLSSNYAVKEAIKNNLGISLISEFVGKEDIKNGDLCILQVEGHEKIGARNFSYIYSPRIKLSETVKVFIEKLDSYKLED